MSRLKRSQLLKLQRYLHVSSVWRNALMKHYQNHTRQDVASNTVQEAVRRAVSNHALAWLVHMILDKGITKRPPARRRE